MNAKLIGLFSGFPDRRFPPAIADVLKAALPVRSSLVFISAWPADFERNDADAAGMHGMFTAWNLGFRSFQVIDDRTENEAAARLVREADCIFLMGGHATKQYELICQKKIDRELQRSTAVILGVSAGSSNMAVRTLDIWESHEPYSALGLTDFTVKAHVSPDDEALLQTLQEISAAYALPICAMEDESAIFIKEDGVTCIGTIRLVSEGQVRIFSPEQMNR